VIAGATTAGRGAGRKAEATVIAGATTAGGGAERKAGERPAEKPGARDKETAAAVGATEANGRTGVRVEETAAAVGAAETR
jgi:hypothetical protein